MQQYSLRPPDSLAELSDQPCTGTIDLVNGDPVVMRIGHISASALIKIDVMSTGLVVRPKRSYQFERFRIHDRDAIITYIRNKQIPAIRRQFQIVGIT